MHSCPSRRAPRATSSLARAESMRRQASAARCDRWCCRSANNRCRRCPSGTAAPVAVAPWPTSGGGSSVTCMTGFRTSWWRSSSRSRSRRRFPRPHPRSWRRSPGSKLVHRRRSTRCATSSAGSSRRCSPTSASHKRCARRRRAPIHVSLKEPRLAAPKQPRRPSIRLLRGDPERRKIRRPRSADHAPTATRAGIAGSAHRRRRSRV